MTSLSLIRSVPPLNCLSSAGWHSRFVVLRVALSSMTKDSWKMSASTRHVDLNTTRLPRTVAISSPSTTISSAVMPPVMRAFSLTNTVVAEISPWTSPSIRKRAFVSTSPVTFNPSPITK